MVFLIWTVFFRSYIFWPSLETLSQYRKIVPVFSSDFFSQTLSHFGSIVSIWETLSQFWKHCLNFGKIASILKTLSQFWNHCLNFGNIVSILETFSQFWKSCPNFGNIVPILEILSQFWKHYPNFGIIVSIFKKCPNIGALLVCSAKWLREDNLSKDAPSCGKNENLWRYNLLRYSCFRIGVW